MAKSKQEIEREADAARKRQVDRANKKRITEEAVAEDALADTPLTQEEKDFIARIEPTMNKGRKVEQSSPAAITRYARLIKRKDVK